LFSSQHKLATASKLLRRITRRYIPAADTGRELVEEKILKSETDVKPLDKMGTGADSPSPPERKKPSISQGLKDGAGEEGRTPDLMLGKHTL
jgi:hypothetical protein